MKEKVIKNNTSQKNVSEKLIKTLLVFICYLLYSNVISIVFSTFNIVNTTLISFVADLIFLICIVFAYRENLKNDLKDLKENYKVIDVIKTVVLWFAIIFIFNICMGVLTDLLWPTASNMQDGNTKLLFDSNTLNLTYKIFKTMVFAIVAEQIMQLSNQCLDSAAQIGEIVAQIDKQTNAVVTTAMRAEEIVFSQNLTTIYCISKK